jgi:hypothetical protein
MERTACGGGRGTPLGFSKKIHPATLDTPKKNGAPSLGPLRTNPVSGARALSARACASIERDAQPIVAIGNRPSAIDPYNFDNPGTLDDQIGDLGPS